MRPCRLQSARIHLLPDVRIRVVQEVDDIMAHLHDLALREAEARARCFRELYTHAATRDWTSIEPRHANRHIQLFERLWSQAEADLIAASQKRTGRT